MFKLFSYFVTCFAAYCCNYSILYIKINGETKDDYAVVSIMGSYNYHQDVECSITNCSLSDKIDGIVNMSVQDLCSMLFNNMLASVSYIYGSYCIACDKFNIIRIIIHVFNQYLRLDEIYNIYNDFAENIINNIWGCDELDIEQKCEILAKCCGKTFDYVEDKLRLCTKIRNNCVDKTKDYAFCRTIFEACYEKYQNKAFVSVIKHTILLEECCNKCDDVITDSTTSHLINGMANNHYNLFHFEKMECAINKLNEPNNYFVQLQSNNGEVITKHNERECKKYYSDCVQHVLMHVAEESCFKYCGYGDKKVSNSLMNKLFINLLTRTIMCKELSYNQKLTLLEDFVLKIQKSQ